MFVTKARRDFVYAGDLAECTVRAADGVGHGTYHFSSGFDVRFWIFTTLLSRVCS